jgi:hypothetical protein
LEADDVPYSESEKDICIEVARAIEHTGIDKEDVLVTVEYTYDVSESVITEGGWSVSDRWRNNGDVVVTVQGKAHVLTPVLGVTADHMMKDLTSKSTFKVEQQYNVDD